ncbi:MAG: FmdE family protein [Faecousia sp.]
MVFRNCHPRVQAIWKACVRFHGKPCSALALGVRVCDTALTKLSLKEAEPNRLVCVSENDSCCVDAIQVGLHCTAGKKHLLFYKTGSLIFTVYDLVGEGSVRICTRPEIAERIRGMRPEDILALPEDKLFFFEEARPMTPRVKDKVRLACNAPEEDVPPRDFGVQDSPDQFGKFDLPNDGACRTFRRFR